MARERFGNLRLSPEDICKLQGIAVNGIYQHIGVFRDEPIGISNTPHVPPPWEEVPDLVAEMCNYANQQQANPIHASAYLMWRHNWIHPFTDGNGRTSRAISYLAMCSGFKMILPGTVTVPEFITADKIPYYEALDAADAAWKLGAIDVSKMESLIQELLKKQLTSE